MTGIHFPPPSSGMSPFGLSLDASILSFSSLEWLLAGTPAPAHLVDPFAGLGKSPHALAEKLARAARAGRMAEAAALQSALFQELARLNPPTFTRFQPPDRVRESFRALFKGEIAVTLLPSIEQRRDEKDIRRREKILLERNETNHGYNPVRILVCREDFLKLGANVEWKYVLVERRGRKGETVFELHVGPEAGKHHNMLLEEEGEGKIAAGRLRFYDGTLQLDGSSTGMPSSLEELKRAKAVLSAILGPAIPVTVERLGFDEPKELMRQEGKERKSARDSQIIQTGRQLAVVVGKKTVSFVLIDSKYSQSPLRLYTAPDLQGVEKRTENDPGIRLAFGTLHQTTTRDGKRVFVYAISEIRFSKGVMEVKKYLENLAGPFGALVTDAETWATDPRNPATTDNKGTVFDVHGFIHLSTEIIRLDRVPFHYVLVEAPNRAKVFRIDVDKGPHPAMVQEGEKVLAAGVIQRYQRNDGGYAYVLDGTSDAYPTFAEEMQQAVDYLNKNLIFATHQRAYRFFDTDGWTISPLNPDSGLDSLTGRP